MAKRRSKPRRVRTGSVAKASKRRARAPRGQIGPQTYAQVRKLVEEKKLPIGKAFAEVAAATGRKAGTVAVTYYRVARQQGGPIRKRVARGGRPGRPGRRPRMVPAVQAVLSRVSAAVRELEAIIAHQAREIERLGSASRLADRIRKALRE